LLAVERGHELAGEPKLAGLAEVAQLLDGALVQRSR
jgi:hypothetical protein